MLNCFHIFSTTTQTLYWPSCLTNLYPLVLGEYLLENQGSHKTLKTEFHDFSMTDLLLSMTPILTWFRIWLWLSHNMHDNHKLESSHSHENKEFHDFSITSSYFPWLIWKFSYSKTFPWLSMTAMFSRIFHDRGNPENVRIHGGESKTFYLVVNIHLKVCNNGICKDSIWHMNTD